MKLTGIDITSMYNTGEDCECVRLVIDGQVIEWSENPDDGYRSYANGPDVVNVEVKNTFDPIDIVRVEINTSDFEGAEYFVEGASKSFLRVGTDGTCDYYPYWVCNYSAELLTKGAD